jgi:hypothetical protein
MKSWPRDVLLAACPHLSCSRRKQCFLLAQGDHCIKTHYVNADEWRDEVTARIYELQKQGDPNPETKYLSGDDRAAYVYKLLKERARELGLKV